MSEHIDDPLQASADRAGLLATIQQQAAQLVALGEELAETNNGVVALYAELDDRAEQLRQASDLKSRFLSYMSHEFRTPLGAITSLCGILLDQMDGPLTEEQQRQVGFVKDSAVELSAMVNDLLDLAKVDAGRVTISPEWFEMVDLFSALRGMFRPILEGSSVALVFEELDNVPRLYTDHKKLSQILRNFVSNALKFTPEGKVCVSASHDGAGLITFSVTDTGIGISAENQLALFNDFVQIDSPLQKRLKGTGLGLALCRRLGQLLGGDVGVESEPGVGSRFFLTIPVSLPGPESTDTPRHFAIAGEGANDASQ